MKLDFDEYEALPEGYSFEDRVTVYDNAYEACIDCHAFCVLTEWDEFKDLDYEKIYASMMKPAFAFDGRNILELAILNKIGFDCYAIGKPTPEAKNMKKLSIY